MPAQVQAPGPIQLALRLCPPPGFQGLAFLTPAAALVTVAAATPALRTLAAAPHTRAPALRTLAAAPHTRAPALHTPAVAAPTLDLCPLDPAGALASARLTVLRTNGASGIGDTRSSAQATDAM